MSLYATVWDLADFDHALDCARMVKVAGYDAVWEQDPDRPCTCQAGPIAYRGSHILPSDDDPRGGCLDLGAIPGFIWDTDRPAIGDDDHPWWPWLRVSVFADGRDATVVLTRGHVADLHGALGEWLDNTPGADDAPESDPAPDLSVREEQVLRAVAAGLTNVAIARALIISVDTVKCHFRAVCNKLGARNRANAVARGYDLGLLPGGDR